MQDLLGGSCTAQSQREWYQLPLSLPYFDFMGISAIYGKPGKGKSHFATFYGIYLANFYEKKLVSNFFFDPDKLALYCKLMGYHWLSENLNKGIIYYIDCDKALSDILSIKDSIVLLDEAAIFLPARGSANNTPKQVIKDLVQVRHDSQYLIYLCQNEHQVDSFLRNLTEEIFHCNGQSKWSRKLRNQELFWKTVHLFPPDHYAQWIADPKLRKNPIKTRILATKSWTGMLSVSDMLLFQVYDSFNRLEAQHLELGTDLHQLSYQVLPEKKFPCIVGRNPHNFHRLSWLVSFLFPRIPEAALPLKDVLNLETKLAKFIEKRVPSKLNRLERRIVMGSAIAFILGVLGVVM